MRRSGFVLVCAIAILMSGVVALGQAPAVQQTVAAAANGPAPMLLWPKGAPGALGVADEDKPSLTAYLPAANPTKTAVVIAPGGGVDFRLNRRIHLRLADFEYQFWPQAAYGTTPAFSSIGVSSGIRVRIF